MSKKNLWSVQKLVLSKKIFGHAGQPLQLNQWKTISPPLPCERANHLAAIKMQRGVSYFRAINGVAEALKIGAVIEEVQP
jgi:hypothetical protein